MMVLDASAVLELLLRGASAGATAERVLRSAGSLHAPHLLDVEVAQVLRRYSRAGTLADGRAAEALVDLAALRIERHSHDWLLPRVWELRHNLTAYDAAYVTLAEALGCVLVTGDGRLARASGVRCRIELLLGPD
jgi:predicted nucleic acid-binding protein